MVDTPEAPAPCGELHDGALYTTRECVEALKISKPTFYAWCRRHGVRRVMFGRAVRFQGREIARARRASERPCR